MAGKITQEEGRVMIMERRLKIEVEKRLCAERSAVASEQRAASAFLEINLLKKKLQAKQALVDSLKENFSIL